jgi:HEAT repeat protein
MMKYYAPQVAKMKDRRDIKGLIKALRDKNPAIREWAAGSLGELGDRSAVEPLCSALKDPAESVRMSAASALGAIGDPSAFESLCSALSDASIAVRGGVVEALEKIGDPRAVDPLCAAYENKYLKIWIAKALIRMGDVRAIPILCESITVFRDSHLCVATINKLVRIGDARAVEPLCAALEDSRTDVWTAAVYALVRFDDVRAVVPFFKMLTKKDQPFLVRRIFAAAIAKIGGPSAIPLLYSALEDPCPEVVAAAAEMLARLGDSEAFEPLCKALEFVGNDVVQYAAEGLGELGDSRALDPLNLVMKRNPIRMDCPNPWNLQMIAAGIRAVGKIGGQTAIPVLEEMLRPVGWKIQGHNWPEIVAAAGTLAELGHARVIEMLRDAFADSNWKKRIASTEVLAKLEDRSDIDLLTAQAFFKDLYFSYIKEVNWRAFLAAMEDLINLGNQNAVYALYALPPFEYYCGTPAWTIEEALCCNGDPRILEAVLASYNSLHLHALHVREIFNDGFYRLMTAVILKDIKVRKAAIGVPPVAGRAEGGSMSEGEPSLESIEFPVFKYTGDTWIGSNPKWVNRVQRESDSAIAWFDSQQFVPIPTEGGEYGAATYCFEMASIAQREGGIKEAWAGFHQALRRFLCLNDEKMIGETCFHLGLVYGAQENWEMARLLFLQSAHLAKAIGDQKGYAWSLSYLGDTCDKLGNKPLAKEFLSAALPIFQSVSPEDASKIEKALRRLQEG